MPQSPILIQGSADLNVDLFLQKGLFSFEGSSKGKILNERLDGEILDQVLRKLNYL